MSHKATNWLGHINPTNLSHAEYRLLSVLCDFSDPETNISECSYIDMIEKTAMSRSGIAKCMRELEGVGFLSRIKSPGDVTKYKLNID